MKQKLKYFISSAQKSIKGNGCVCPSCGYSDSVVVSRKYLVTALRRCCACKLLYRTPTTSTEENLKFYQEDYEQGFTTDCPSDERLKEDIAQKFKRGEKDYSGYIDIICAAGGKKGHKLFDFGCSWGYGSWQFNEYGFNVESYEISVPRASYAKEKLGVNVYRSLPDLPGQFDIFFSSHVLEHVPSVKDAIDFGMSILKPGGLFVSFTPNGSDGFREAKFDSWNSLWGNVHPNFLDDEFYRKYFSQYSHMIASVPYPLNEIKKWGTDLDYKESNLKLDGEELLVLVRK